MKGSTAFWLTCLILSAGAAGAEVSLIRNGSFEMDGPIFDITTQSPMNWPYVNVDDSQFSGFIYNYWSTNGNWSLTLSTGANAAFLPGDSATVGQCVFFTDVNRIACDVELTTEYPGNAAWDSNLFSAVVAIDNNIIWDSNSLGVAENGDYHIDINNLNIPNGSHLLSVGVKTNTASPPYYYSYFASWDSIRFVRFSGAQSYLPGDYNRDCNVDIYDLDMFADGWLQPEGAQDVNDFIEFAALAGSWLQEGCTSVPDEPNFVEPPQSDLNNDGVTDYTDLLTFCEGWLGQGVPCVMTDLNGDGVVDFEDFALFSENW